ncbi:MAG: hypothetical protein K2X37_01420 [Chitinophagaceae bacterium]|nr:hypothetical protein [Chitinophagaceae bacterium]
MKKVNGILIILSLVFGLILITQSCQKSDNLTPTAIQRTDKELIEVIVNNTEFALFNSNIKKIVELSRLTNLSQEKKLNELNDFAKKADSKGSTVFFLNSLGLLNADSIIALNERNFNIIYNIKVNIPELRNSESGRVKMIFNQAIELWNSKNKLNENLLRSLDVCSSNYASGRAACEKQLALELSAASVAGAAGAAAGTPLAGGIIFFGGVAIAYLHEHSCKQDVLSAWTDCRASHPIH